MSDLRLLAGAAFLSAAGDLLALVTLALVVHELTGSGLAVSALFATTMVPVVALAPVAGQLVDRLETVRLLVVSSLLAAAAAAALAFAGDLASILALSALVAAIGAVAQPAEFALVPRVAGADLARANGIMEAARYAGFAAGPAVAGAIVALGGPRLALLVNAGTFLAVAAAAAALRTRRPPEASAAAPRARDGAVHLWRDPPLRIALGANVVALLVLSGAITIEVFYVKDVLGAGDAVYGAIVAVWMAAMVAGAAGLAPRLPQRHAAALALVALGVQGAGMAAQTAWAIVPAAFAGYAIGGLGHGVKNTLLRLLLAQRVPAALHGRAFAAYNAARNGAELAALAGGGALVAGIGPRAALLLVGLAPVAAALAGLVALRAAARRQPRRISRPTAAISSSVSSSGPPSP
ncbi:MAG TPA: MFS transporter [Capillimicrobium sp.]|nr:MFS transporter [Capillimicrobium sp.]